MRWIAPTDPDTATVTLEKPLWDTAEQFRASSGLKPQQYSDLTLGLIFMRFVERLRRRCPHGYELCSYCFRP